LRGINREAWLRWSRPKSDSTTTEKEELQRGTKGKEPGHGHCPLALKTRRQNPWYGHSLILSDKKEERNLDLVIISFRVMGQEDRSLRLTIVSF
jgi:hypothetical protein